MNTDLLKSHLMTHMSGKRTKRYIMIGLSIGAFAIALLQQPAYAEKFQISLGGGSLITVEVSNETLTWTDVLENGEMNEQTVKFSNIRQLVLSQAPATKQVAEIHKFLNQLESENYQDRMNAEEQLSDPKTGGRFRSLIKARVNHNNYEARYRIERILKRLDQSTQESSSEFDILTLKDGTTLEGDAGDFVLLCNYRGNPSSFKRAEIELISTPNKPKPILEANAKIAVRMFHQHQEMADDNKVTKHFYRPGQVMVDFDNAPNGAELERQTSVNEVFTPFGLRLDTEQVGFIGISGYPFKFSPLPVAGNSICVFETIGSYAKRFKGVTEIRFCMPNQPAVPAGVHEIGMFIARVNHSRDFILEAYNADNELLASVESTDKPCVFSGVKSNEPITKIRILSNPYLFRVDRVIDEDYGIDSICFSPPVPVLTPADSEPGIIRLKNGDLLKGNEISIKDRDTFSIALTDGKSMTIQRDELQTIRFNNQLDGKIGKPEKGAQPFTSIKKVQIENFWMAILNDRSTIRVTPGATFKSTLFKNLTFKPDDLLGLKASRNATRFPEASDFNKESRVLVFPTCRIASNNIKFSDEGFTWPKDALKLEQPVHTDEDENDEQDPTPPFTKISYANSGPESSPTVWFNPPKSRQPGTGRLRLTDGQLLTLGGTTGFEITEFQQDEITVSIGEQQAQIPLSKVLSIDFPSN